MRVENKRALVNLAPVASQVHLRFIRVDPCHLVTLSARGEPNTFRD